MLISYSIYIRSHYNSEQTLSTCGIGLTCFAGSALAVETTDAIDASGAVETGGAGTVVDVGGTVGPCPAVNADAGEAAGRVGACGTVVTNAGP